MLLTVIIPTYNSESVLRKTLDSIKDQSYEETDIEVIIVDGLSTDRTMEIVETYSTIIKKVISEKDKGIYDAMNKGIDAASGKYCYFIGAGDTLIKGVLQLILPELKKFDGLFYGNVVRTNGNVIYDGRFSPFKLFRRNICHQAIFYPTDKIKKMHYNLKYKVLADYYLNLLIFADENIPKKYFNINIAYYDDLSLGFSSRTEDKEFLNDYNYIILKNFSFKYKLMFIFLIIIRKIKKAVE